MSKHKYNPKILPEPSNNNQAATRERDSREDIFIRNLFLGLGVYEAGIQAGYGEGFCKSTIYQKFKSKAFQDKIRDYALANNSSSIPKVIDLYRLTINKLHAEVCNGKLDNVAKLKHLPTQILQMGRVLAPDMTGGLVPTINIASMQVLIQSKVKDDDSTGSDSE